MKKYLTTTLPFAIIGMCVLASSPAVALQDSSLSLGPKLGLNYTTVTGDVPDEIGYKLGFCGGAFLAYAFSDWFTVQGELLYTQKGAEASEGPVTLTLSLDYIEIPVLAVLTIPTQSIWTPKIFIGPAFGFNVNAEEKLQEGDEERKRDLGGIKDYEVGIIFGAGMDVAVGPGAITADIRYNLGMTNLDDDDEDDVKNGVISFMVGYAF